MENIVFEDTPLADCMLLEGEGEGWTSAHEGQSNTPSFAPRGPSQLRSRTKDRLPRPLRLNIPENGPVARIQSACSRAVHSRLGRADNARFLEHFRYVIVASQLLNEPTGSTAFRNSAIRGHGTETPVPTTEYKAGSTTLTGAVSSAATAFALVWLIHWARGSGRSTGPARSRILLVLAVFTLVGTFLYAYARRQWLQYLRQQAVGAISALVTNTQALEATTSSALTLIQEVELVSRGYRISSPLPPITRMEDGGQTRRCAKLRKSLFVGFSITIPAFADACGALRPLLKEVDLERYMEVYDITNEDLREASAGISESEFEDPQNLKALRVFHYRQGTLRRVLLCSLLALEADGGKPDFSRWRAAVSVMEKMAAITGDQADNLQHVLTEEEHFNIPPTPKAATTPARSRLREQVRKLSSLSQGIRGLQAKMQILREESNKTLEESVDVTELGSSLMAQYESIGADLKSLMQAWENGKQSLAINIDKHERRVSQQSSGLRSPVPSLGGLTAVEEGGSPSDALRALNGEAPSRNSMSSLDVSGSASDEEVFEAIAIPKQRSAFSREERIAKMQEERARQASLRDRKEASTNMMKELETVISLRTPKRSTNGRITSI